MGCAAVFGGLTCVSNAMFYAASKALASTVTNEDIALGRAYPKIDDIRAVTPTIAAAVINQAMEEGQQVKIKKLHDLNNLVDYIRSKMWEPKYQPIVFKYVNTVVYECLKLICYSNSVSIIFTVQTTHKTNHATRLGIY